MRWRKVAILGVGLLGGSLGLALRRRGLAGEVAGFVRREATLAQAVALGALDNGSTRLKPALRDADLVVLCTPVAQMDALAAGFPGVLSPGALVTDVGSVKSSVIRAVAPVVTAAGSEFIGSHPMAGSERTGVQAAREDLFEGAVTVVTPQESSSPRAVAQIRQLWESVGSRVVMMSDQRHDQLVSRSSHLPHLIAATLAHWILDPGHLPDQSDLCAAGFRDTTRVASGSPEMWRDIAMANREAILESLAGFQQCLDGLRHALESGDAAAVDRFLGEAKQRRDAWIERGTARSTEA